MTVYCRELSSCEFALSCPEMTSPPMELPYLWRIKFTLLLRICALVSRDDVTSNGITVPVANQVHIAGATKSHSKNAFENVFGPDAAQERICSSTLPELVQGVFSGQDCALIALGGKSRGKNSIFTKFQTIFDPMRFP
ncbi:unnamed protein product [Strongylus vulgaris]|uniref:Kinesin motor domain-containing protein n=1 Tax=Strongylus vulgaris TaxID=40348 RepID=A0A3P7LE10_STRVU|nr:unnamed protein product [Strongylus vulgaris]